jgi:hypothetical protein
MMVRKKSDFWEFIPDLGISWELLKKTEYADNEYNINSQNQKFPNSQKFP